MDLSHDHFDALAVAHVMGGLDTDQATEFRGHLLGCRDCRARVAELRSLANDLDIAAREERAAQRRRPVVDHGMHDQDIDPVEIDRGRRWLFVAGAAVLVILGMLVVWNQALRFDNITLVGATANREAVLASLGDGVALPVETRAGVTGVAALAIDQDIVALSLGRVGELADMNHVVVWRNDGTEAAADWVEFQSFTPNQLVGQRLALVVPVTPETSEVIVTVEQSVMPDVPNTFPIFRATVRP